MGGRDVDRDPVALGGGAIDGFQLGELAPQPIDGLVDIIVDHVDTGDLHFEALVSLDLDRGTDLDHGIEGDRTGFHALGDVDLRRGDDIDLVFDDGLGVVVGQGVPEGFVAGVALPDPGFQHLAGRLSGAEPGQPDLSGQPTEGGVELFFELGFLHFDDDLDLVALEGLNRGSHLLKCSHHH